MKRGYSWVALKGKKYCISFPNGVYEMEGNTNRKINQYRKKSYDKESTQTERNLLCIITFIVTKRIENNNGDVAIRCYPRPFLKSRTTSACLHFALLSWRTFLPAWVSILEKNQWVRILFSHLNFLIVLIFPGMNVTEQIK
jgi:hypothetical protein